MTKKITLGIILLGAFITFASVSFADFPIDSSWDSITDGWSCQNYAGLGKFDTRDHHTLDSSSSTPDSSTSLRIMYPVGWPNGYVSYMCWNILPSRQNDWWGQYYIKYSSNWDWNGVVEKQFYFWQGTMSTGDVIGLSAKQQIQFRNQYANTNIYSSNTGYNPTFQRNVWYKIKFHITMNTPGSSNGVGEIWVNDQLVMRHTNIKWLRDSDSTGNGTGKIELNPIWGGSGSPKNADAGPGDQYVWFDKTIFQSTDPGGGFGNIKTPMPATSIQIDE